jgi:hypothetical protein
MLNAKWMIFQPFIVHPGTPYGYWQRKKGLLEISDDFDSKRLCLDDNFADRSSWIVSELEIVYQLESGETKTLKFEKSVVDTGSELSYLTVEYEANVLNQVNHSSSIFLKSSQTSDTIELKKDSFLFFLIDEDILHLDIPIIDWSLGWA